MSDHFSLIPIERLLSWILAEERTDHLFAIHKGLFFNPVKNPQFSMHRYAQILESPFGVAAGPHTQMAQNLLSAWLTGSRYLELKTVQTLDELDVSKPCIDMEDEGYNCEWSQELKLDESYHEYLSAWILVHVLRHHFGWGFENGLGCIFNMSVGYNLEGILKPNVQKFFERMKNCKKEKDEKIAALSSIYPAIREIEIPDCISNNITLSTMHGCPPDEIEKIAMYLVKDLKLNTTIKLNPTLLGPDLLRGILNKTLGFGAEIPDLAFEHDLKYPDALKIIENVKSAAQENHVDFSLKLTNTLESVNNKKNFPAREKMMYMSGRALHPISVNLARKLQFDFSGGLDISFSAGVDAFNAPRVLACGLKPATVCSDLLKPGGYGRMHQYFEVLHSFMQKLRARDLEEMILKQAGIKERTQAILQNLDIYAKEVLNEKRFQKSFYTGELVKTKKTLQAFDCVEAPCVQTCPTHQEIPDYMYYVATSQDDKALDCILRTNPLPSICGMVCDHLCEIKCTRMNYDSTLLIREIKRFVTENTDPGSSLKPAEKNGLKAAIIGAGPSGLSCAWFLALHGFEVEIFESKELAGGMIADAIPSFRLSDGAIHKDIQRIMDLGVKIHYKEEITEERFCALQKQFDYIYVAVGAKKAKTMALENEDIFGVYDFLQFLSLVRQNKKIEIGKVVAVVGGGNSAMDVARTAWRIVGKEGRVILIYRRTIQEMPADAHEIKALLDEGIEVMELHHPVKINAREGRLHSLTLQKMELKGSDASGRLKPVAILGSEFDLEIDCLIPAIGQDVIAEFFPGKILNADSVTYETSQKNVFAGGDAVRGASSLIKAIADGRMASKNIIESAIKTYKISPVNSDKGLDMTMVRKNYATRVFGVDLPEVAAKKRQNFSLVHPSLDEESARKEASRCLHCNDVCDVCTTVCPNRANFFYPVSVGDYPVMRMLSDGTLVKNGTFRISQSSQVLNVGDWCNECGNCTTFCPTSGRPFADKPKFYLTQESFLAEENGYRLVQNALFSRKNGILSSLKETHEGLHYESGSVFAVLDAKTFEILSCKNLVSEEISLQDAVQMAVLYSALKKSHLVLE